MALVKGSSFCVDRPCGTFDKKRVEYLLIVMIETLLNNDLIVDFEEMKSYKKKQMRRSFSFVRTFVEGFERAKERKRDGTFVLICPSSDKVNCRKRCRCFYEVSIDVFFLVNLPILNEIFCCISLFHSLFRRFDFFR